VAQSTVLQTVADPAYEPRRGTSPQSVRHDAALLQLANAIPAAVAPPFPVATLDQHSHDISIVSYARGRDAALSWQRNCDVIGRDQSLFAFDCDVYFGSSGAPVFDLSAGRARIVSIISAGSRTETGTVSYGMALPGLVSDLQQALRTGRGVTEADKAASGVKARILTGGAKGNGGAKFLQP
jgi:protease YdgD